MGAAARSRGTSAERHSAARVRDVRGVHDGGRRRGDRHSAARGVRVPGRGHRQGARRTHAPAVPHEPRQPDGPCDTAGGHRGDRGCRTARDGARRRGVHRLRRRERASAARDAPQRNCRPDLREGARPGRPAGRLPHRAPRHARAAARDAAAVQPECRGGGGAPRGADRPRVARPLRRRVASVAGADLRLL